MSLVLRLRLKLNNYTKLDQNLAHFSPSLDIAIVSLFVSLDNCESAQPGGQTLSATLIYATPAIMMGKVSRKR